ncbi:MAG: flagellar basal body-associated FliL family protein [Hyphomonadaceae bacterium]
MAKKEKPKKPDEPEADAPAEGEGAPAKKKMAGKTLVLFIILPAVLVLGGGGAAAMMLLGGGGGSAAASEAHGEEGDHPAPEEGHGEAAADDHGGGGGEEHGGGDDHGGGASPEGEGEADVGHRLPCEGGSACYYAMPKMVVNLAGTEGQRSPYMELELSLEASNASVFNRIPEMMPRLKDQLNAFLRELRVEDLNGSAGTFTLRRELLKRFNLVLDPKKIDAVLIEGMLIQ